MLLYSGKLRAVKHPPRRTFPYVSPQARTCSNLRDKWEIYSGCSALRKKPKRNSQSGGESCRCNTERVLLGYKYRNSSANIDTPPVMGRPLIGPGLA